MVSEHDALCGFAAICLPEKASSVLNQPGLSVPLLHQVTLEPSTYPASRGSGSAISAEQGSSIWQGYCTLRYPWGPGHRAASQDGCTHRTAFLPCCCQEAPVYVAIDNLTLFPRDLG